MLKKQSLSNRLKQIEKKIQEKQGEKLDLWYLSDEELDALLAEYQQWEKEYDEAQNKAKIRP
jgi:hypothetical protein